MTYRPAVTSYTRMLDLLRSIVEDKRPTSQLRAVCMPLAQCRSLAASVAYRTLYYRRTTGIKTAAMAGRGAFILFEGVDRSGKSTQAAQLTQALQDQGVSGCGWLSCMLAVWGRQGKACNPGSLACACALMLAQVAAEQWNFPDRSTNIGKTIDEYLKGNAESDDATMHLLFSANRWEKR